MTEDTTSLNDPTLLKRFEVIEPVGRGPHGTVYKVRHRVLGEMRNLKVFEARFAESPSKELILRRFQLAQTLVSPLCQRVYDLEATEEGQLVVEAEWIQGISLDKHVGTEKVATADLLKIIGQLASALRDAHMKKLLHLNLKRENVFLREGQTDQVVLTDFLLGESGMPSNPWVPPEYSSSEGFAPPSDAYMLGKLALNLLQISEEESREPKELLSRLTQILHPQAARVLAASLDRDSGNRPGINEFREIANPSRRVPDMAQEARAIRESRRILTPFAGEAKGPNRQPIRSAVIWKYWGWVGIALIPLLLLYILLPSHPAESPTALPKTTEQAEPHVETIPTIRVNFSYKVLNRPGEGDPSHHPHTLVTMNGNNLFVLRSEAGYSSTVERARSVVARLQTLFEGSNRPGQLRFSVLQEGSDYTLNRSGDVGRSRPILIIHQGDLEGYKRRSSHHLTQEKLAVWYRDRLQSFWDVMVAGLSPRVKTQYVEVEILTRLADQARKQATAENIPLSQALFHVFSRISDQDFETLQESVFSPPESVESHKPLSGP